LGGLGFSFPAQRVHYIITVDEKQKILV